MFQRLELLSSPNWQDYELIDSGRGQKLERFGPYTFVRPEHQAVWQRRLPEKHWQAAQAVFQPTIGEEMGGKWQFRQPTAPSWKMQYGALAFEAQMSSSRHVGVFPEQAAHWDWMAAQIQKSPQPTQVLNLFGYTGLATLACAAAGSKVTHVDASRKAIAWARQNQRLSGLADQPIRWMVDDALKFVLREGRRGVKYDGLVLDPPKFGRGPKGEVWECFEMLPTLLAACREILCPHPLFVVLTAYAIRASALSVYYALEEMTRGLGGTVSAGELITIEKSGGRMLSQAIYARWHAMEQQD
ncbi:MAG: class I SAM-dependent methyltransferase [Chloroflexota bacterium]